MIWRGIDVDKWGGIASFVCAIHCALTGLALGLLSVLGLGFFGSVWTDVFFIGFALLFGTFAVRQGLRRHRKWYPAFIFGVGLTAIAVGHLYYKEGTAACTLLSVVGGGSLVAFHTLNWRLGHRCVVSDRRAPKSIPSFPLA